MAYRSAEVKTNVHFIDPRRSHADDLVVSGHGSQNTVLSHRIERLSEGILTGIIVANIRELFLDLFHCYHISFLSRSHVARKNASANSNLNVRFLFVEAICIPLTRTLPIR